jgi:hypothetical protein
LSPLRWRAVMRQDDKSDRAIGAAEHSRWVTGEVGRRLLPSRESASELWAPSEIKAQVSAGWLSKERLLLATAGAVAGRTPVLADTIASMRGARVAVGDQARIVGAARHDPAVRGTHFRIVPCCASSRPVGSRGATGRWRVSRPRTWRGLAGHRCESIARRSRGVSRGLSCGCSSDSCRCDGSRRG